MNDTELDEMLDQWVAPPAPASLREGVRAGLASGKTASRRWLTWPVWEGSKGLFAGVAAGVVLFVLVIGQAFPQSGGLFSGFRIPYAIESESVRHEKDGSLTVTHWTTMNIGGYIHTLAIDRDPNDPLDVTLNPVRMLMWQVVPSLFAHDNIESHRAFVHNGCVRARDTVIGHETILGHFTTAVHVSGDPHITQWMAPDLECAVLRLTDEEPGPDGTVRLFYRSQALKVTLNH